MAQKKPSTRSEVNPPEDLVGMTAVHRCQPVRELGRQQADGREACQVRVLPQFGGRHAGPFDEKAGDEDGKEQEWTRVVVLRRSPALSA